MAKRQHLLMLLDVFNSLIRQMHTGPLSLSVLDRENEVTIANRIALRFRRFCFWLSRPGRVHTESGGALYTSTFSDRSSDTSAKVRGFAMRSTNASSGAPSCMASCRKAVPSSGALRHNSA